MDDKNLMQRHNSRVYDNFLVHWGYVKREKINGKWRYWYENPKTGKIIGDKPSNGERVVNLLKNGKEIIGDEVKDLLDNDKPITSSWNTKKEQKTLGEKAKSMVNTAKDKLGVDEREAYTKAKLKSKIADKKASEADLEAKAAIRNVLDNPPNRDATRKMSYKVETAKDWKEIARTRGEEYMKAKAEYMNTPLGTALKVAETIKDIPFEVEYALKKLSKKKK